MKKFFMRRNQMVADVPQEKVEAYRAQVMEAMRRMGADQSEMCLVHRETILNALQINSKPEDVAWAILQ